MHDLTRIELLNAAAYGLVIARCRRAHIHDVRGGLQSIHGAIELLARAAKGAAAKEGLADRSTALANRAMNSHEKLLNEWAQLAPETQEAAAALDLGALIGEISRFLQNDAITRAVAFRVTASGDTWVAAPPRRCRLYLLGLCALALDEMPAQSVADFMVSAVNDQVRFELTPAPRRAILDPRALWAAMETAEMELPPTSFDLVLSLASHWLGANGGRLEAQAGQSAAALRLYFPAAGS